MLVWPRLRGLWLQSKVLSSRRWSRWVFDLPWRSESHMCVLLRHIRRPQWSAVAALHCRFWLFHAEFSRVHNLADSLERHSCDAAGAEDLILSHSTHLMPWCYCSGPAERVGLDSWRSSLLLAWLFAYWNANTDFQRHEHGSDSYFASLTCFYVFLSLCRRSHPSLFLLGFPRGLSSIRRRSRVLRRWSPSRITTSM